MHKTFKLGLSTAGALVALLGSVAQPALADLAPSSGDVVGVGSDTVQYAMDFVADGDHLGDAGFNVGLTNRLVNFDATADGNARFAYGPNGLGTGQCTPGTGSTAGTGNQTTTHADAPCGLNPTVVLRAGLSPVLRPNGSGAGAKALLADGTLGNISYSRASAAQAGTTGVLAGGNYDSITIGTDPLAILQATTSNAVTLTAAQLKDIYTCASTARTWNQVGGTSTDTIVPLVPQIGSGTRSAFLSAVGGGTAITPGPCAINVEENDPTAITQNYVALATTAPSGAASGATTLPVASLGDGTTQGAQVVVGQLVSAVGIAAGTTVTAIDSVNKVVTLSAATTAAVAANAPVSFSAQAADVIEPMSGGRLNLFQGKNGSGANNAGTQAIKYFLDPSCSYKSSATACASGNPLNPPVKFSSLTSTLCPASPAFFCVNRPLYLYFRAADVNSTTPFNAGSTLNWVRTLFYNPCNTGMTGCSTIGGVSYGPGGQPYVATAAGQALISAAGISPNYTVTVGGA